MMQRKWITYTTLAVIVCLVTCSAARAQLSVDVEGNYIFSIPYNTVRIPSQGGTEIDIANDLETKQTFTYRVRINYAIKNRHVLSLLAAPLTIKSSGTLNRAIVYDDAVFPAGQPVSATYTFNSYRFTYRYMFVWKEKLKVGAGISAKIREANITLRNENRSADFPNVGFVPLVNIYAEWLPTEKLGVLIEGDALGTGQGRAEDIFAGVSYSITPSTKLKGGYRFLEGGADVADNYNFSFINYVALGAIITLHKKE